MFRVAKPVGSVTVEVNEGQPYAMALADGFGYVAAVSGHPELQARPSVYAGRRQVEEQRVRGLEIQGQPLNIQDDGPSASVVLTAYDHHGALVWAGTIDN